MAQPQEQPRIQSTDNRTEVMAGLATFMTMAYILFVNPSILADAGVPREAAAVATALGAGIASIAMGFFSNYPLALASGMGLNAALAYGAVIGGGYTWQQAMTIIFIEGIIITLLVLTNVREAVMNAIPINLKRAIGVGIGLFIAFIGLKNAGIVTHAASIIAPPGAEPFIINPTFVQMGNLTDPQVLLAIFGLIITLLLMARRVAGAILYGILGTTGVALLFNSLGFPLLAPEAVEAARGVVALPTAASFATIGQLDFSVMAKGGFWALVFAFLVTDFFDTMGTVVAVGGPAGYLRPDGSVPRLKNVLLIDSLAAALGGFLGASSITTYIESASGVGVGGRRGLTAITVGVLFLLAIFFAPLVGLVPAAATAPALIIVGFLMMAVVTEIDFSRVEEGVPAFLTLIGMPLTFSISHGIGFGFISYVLLKAFTGKAREVHPLLYGVALLFVLDMFGLIQRLLG